jgi:putative CocE/NonD family hydrolase
VSLVSELVGRFLGLPAPRANRIRVERGLAVPMRDGVHLRTDHYAPTVPEGQRAPTVLVRTPYGLGMRVGLLARVLAGQGFHVVVQSCRGTFRSGGVFDPMRNERTDGLDTIEWLRDQPWYSGELCMWGPSYVGFVQWAVAAEAGEDLRALVVVVTASDFRNSTYAGGSFSLEATLTWAALLQGQRTSRLANVLDALRGQPRLRRGLAHLPLSEADQVATGVAQQFVREWLAEPGDDYWAERAHTTRLSEVTTPVLMIGGWHDIFLPWQLVDYAALRTAGARPRLTIGPWTHGSVGLYLHSVREAVRWFRLHTAQPPGDAGELPVRVHVGGVDEWRELPDWPPDARTVDWFFHGAGGLSPDPPGATTADAAHPDRFRYDPADPTPAVGGPRLVANIAGVRDNRELEARPDVVVYTSQALPVAIDVIGAVEATVHIGSSGPYFDVFVRLCDVDASGRSWNVCDGLVRVAPGRFASTVDSTTAVRVPLWPTAYRFGAGHRIRVQVSGGAHPRFARNTGTEEPLAGATTLRPVDLAIHHDQGHPSAIHLPITG